MFRNFSDSTLSSRIENCGTMSGILNQPIPEITIRKHPSFFVEIIMNLFSKLWRNFGIIFIMIFMAYLEPENKNRKKYKMNPVENYAEYVLIPLFIMILLVLRKFYSTNFWKISRKFILRVLQRRK